MAQWITQVMAIFRSKTLWLRVVVTLMILGLISYIILTDQSCHFGQFGCDTKSKVKVDINK
jgi:hypothetical protein